jgi:hypothetical protein
MTEECRLVGSEQVLRILRQGHFSQVLGKLCPKGRRAVGFGLAKTCDTGVLRRCATARAYLVVADLPAAQRFYTAVMKALEIPIGGAGEGYSGRMSFSCPPPTARLPKAA